MAKGCMILSLKLLYLNMYKIISSLITGFSLMACAPGCVKKSCCGFPTYHYNCSNGSSAKGFTITAAGSSIQNLVNDSLNYYQANGYTCYQTGPPYSSACVYGAVKIKKAIKDGDICIDPIGAAGSCGTDPGSSCE